MMKWAIVLAAVLGFAAAAVAPARADTCGEENQLACEKIGGSSFVDPRSRNIPYTEFFVVYTCNHTSLQTARDAKGDLVCTNARQPSGLTCCTQVNYYDRYGTGSTVVNKGYYAVADLTKAWVVVPNLSYPDWCVANPSYKNPVMTAEEWAMFGGYHARLLINANFWSAELDPNLNRCNGAKGLTVSNTVVVSPTVSSRDRIRRHWCSSPRHRSRPEAAMPSSPRTPW
jgi:hypothetical protein